MLIDDFRRSDLRSCLGTQWQSVSDRVMGGVSQETVAHDCIEGRHCLRMRGEVSLANNGGFIQAALDLKAQRGTIDATRYIGIQLTVHGNEERYSVHLRTPDNARPWQSYRSQFFAERHWQIVRLPFVDFQPHRLNTPLDLHRLKRIGVVAIGRAFLADLAIAELKLYQTAGSE